MLLSLTFYRYIRTKKKSQSQTHTAVSEHLCLNITILLPTDDPCHLQHKQWYTSYPLLGHSLPLAVSVDTSSVE